MAQDCSKKLAIRKKFDKIKIMKITKDLVNSVTKLSRLRIGKEEILKYQKDLEEILDYFSILEKVDTDNIEPIAQITNLQNVQREDIVEPSNLAEKLIENALKSASGRTGKYIKVKGVFENE
jgi:aspartyl-tRNA(Asn)/glutamyl-tRNA(Gln) amidotransferase subunit C